VEVLVQVLLVPLANLVHHKLVVAVGARAHQPLELAELLAKEIVVEMDKMTTGLEVEEVVLAQLEVTLPLAALEEMVVLEHLLVLREPQ
jgi:hypothetical protein